MNRIPRPLPQNRQIFGYDREFFSHALVLPTRCQNIEGKGEVFLCLRPPHSETRSHNHLRTHRLSSPCLLPLLANASSALNRTTWKRKRPHLQPPTQDPLHPFLLSKQWVCLTEHGAGQFCKAASTSSSKTSKSTWARALSCPMKFPIELSRSPASIGPKGCVLAAT